MHENIQASASSTAAKEGQVHAYGVGAEVGAAEGGHVALHGCAIVSAGHGSAPYLVILMQ